MWRGLYTAGAGMIQETQRTDTIANNLANVNTTGYKRDVAVSSEFEPMLIRRETEIPTALADDPLSCVALGCGKALDTFAKFDGKATNLKMRY